MASLDGAEVCQLVGLLLLYFMKKSIYLAVIVSICVEIMVWLFSITFPDQKLTALANR